MCIINSKSEFDAFVKHNRNKKEIVCWKILKREHGVYYSIIFDNGTPIELGAVLKSNSRRTKPLRDYQQSSRGIYVYTTKQGARNKVCGFGNNYVFRCTANIEDLFAVSCGGGVAVFKQVYLCK
jgi:hypothetical protein